MGLAANIRGPQGAAGLAASMRPPLRSGGASYYCSPHNGNGNGTLVQNTIYAVPFYVPVTTTFTKIAVVTVGTASAQVRLGIYNDNGSGVPDTLILDAGSIATATSGFKTITISQSLTPGWYWLACAMQGAAGSINNITGPLAYLPTANGYTSVTYAGYKGSASVSAGLPNPWGSTYTLATPVPIVYLAPQ